MGAISADLNTKVLDSVSDRFVVHEMSDQEQPVYIAAAFPLREGLTGLKPRLPSGRGLSLKQAQFGACAETIELMCCLAGPYNNNMARIISTHTTDEITATNPLTQEKTAVPAQQVFLDYAMIYNRQLIFDADTTGCAAGRNFDDARERALLECIERDALAIWWYGRQSRAHYDLSILDEIAPRVSWWLSQRSRRTLLIDITSDITVPVVAAVSANENGTFVAIGSSAHSSYEMAALSAVTEMIQTETSMRLAKTAGDEDLRQWIKGASTISMPQFSRSGEVLKKGPTSVQSVSASVTQAGFSANTIDLTLPTYPLAVARVLVPGLCAMKRRYVLGRISKLAGKAKLEPDLETLEPF
jgi:ribosomal protein S12 methylthiotransferase accessory factor YcaO